MGQFKSMTKMQTTEPSVELKLKKGGKVVKKAGGGMMGSPMGAPRGMPSGMPARGGMMGASSPMAPSLAMRRRAMKGMPAGAGPAGPVGGAAQMQAAMPTPGMKKGGESKSVHKAEMSKMKGLEKELKSHESKPASKGHKGLATGGVVDGQGGFKKGGIINTENQGGEYRDTKMDTAKPDHSPAKTGGVKMGNAGGFKSGGMACATGGVAKSNAGGYKKGGKIKGMMGGGMAGDGMMGGGMMDDAMMGGSMYKKGGATKKAFAAGGSVNSGRAVAMPQGNKPASKPVRINELAGTFKKGGRVAPGNPKLQGMFNKENATAMKEAKAQSNLKYGPTKKMAEGGDLSKGAYDKAIGPSKEEMDMAQSIRGFPGKVMKKVKDAAKDLFSPAPKADSITKTQESVTVTPAKKSGGMVNC
jgi:hypothetical protein